MRTNWRGEEIPAYFDITPNDINFLIKETFGRTYTFPKGISCITEEVIPYYCKNPRILTKYLNELCLRGKLKRGTYLIE